MPAELTLEQMLIELQQRWGGSEEVALFAKDDGRWAMDIGVDIFIARTPMAAVIQAYRAGQDDSVGR